MISYGLKKKIYIFLALYIVIIFSYAAAFDRSPMWDDARRKLPKTEEEWVSWFYYEDYRYPAYARRHFVKMGENALPCLLPIIKEKNEIVRFYILNTLGEIKSKNTISIFTDCLKEGSDKIRAYAIETLMTFNKDDLTSNVLPLIRESLNDKNLYIKISVIRALSNLGDNADIDILNKISFDNLSDNDKETLKSEITAAIKKLDFKNNR